MPRSASALLLLLTSVGCATGHPLMPTPNLYYRSGGYPESQVATAVRSTRADLLYVTDRAPETVDGALAYSSRRSASAATAASSPAPPPPPDNGSFGDVPSNFRCERQASGTSPLSACAHNGNPETKFPPLPITEAGRNVPEASDVG